MSQKNKAQTAFLPDIHNKLIFLKNLKPRKQKKVFFFKKFPYS